MHSLSRFILCLTWVCVKSDYFSFENATIRWFWRNGKHETCGNSTNYLKELYPEEVDDGPIRVLINGSIKILHENSVKDIGELYEIDLSNTNLEKVTSGAFRNLPQLGYLHLGGNKLRRIEREAFANLKSCHFLNLSSNQISNLEPQAFKNLPNLAFLHLEKNRIETVSLGVFENITIRILDLSHNLISKIESNFLDKVSTCRGLNLYLILDGNKLEHLDPEFKHENLTHLYLANNSISQLHPRNFARLPKLTFLTLRGNKLVEIPSGVFKNLKMTNLDLSYNEISIIASDAFDQMTKLRIIKLDHNKIKTWDNELFKGSEVLSIILASHNFIEEIPDEAFKHYQNTFSVDLSWNRIKSVSILAFYNPIRGATRLHYLILRGNKLDSWERFLLINRARISIYGLDLRGNRLECFSGDVSDVFGAVDVVWLGDNKFDESCVQDVEKYTVEHQAYRPPEVLTNEMLY